MGASFRANQMSVHAETARDRRDGWTDGQTTFQLYIVDDRGWAQVIFVHERHHV